MNPVIRFLSLSLALCGLFTSCGLFVPITGSGNRISETRAATNVNAVSSTGAFEVTVVSGDREQVVLEGDDNLLEYVTTAVNSGNLELTTREGVSLFPSRPIKIRVTVARLGSLKVTGSGSLDADCRYKSPFSVESTGSAQMNLRGEVASWSMRLTGSGGVDGSGLSSGDGALNLTGSGNASVRATNELKVELLGSGNVDYYGSPRLTLTLLGSGRVTAK